MGGGIPLKRANRAGHPAREIGRHFMMRKFLLLAAIGGLVFATSMAPAEAAPRRAALLMVPKPLPAPRSAANPRATAALPRARRPIGRIAAATRLIVTVPHATVQPLAELREVSPRNSLAGRLLFDARLSHSFTARASRKPKPRLS